MQKKLQKSYLLAILLLISCSDHPAYVGKWQEIRKTAILEFRNDGTFTAIDNQGVSVSGKFNLLANGTVTFEIAHQDFSPEIVRAKLILKDNELTFIPEKGNEVERYQRKQ